MGLSLLSQIISDRARGNDLRLHQGRFSLDIGDYFCTKRAEKHCNGLPGAVVKSLSLEGFKTCLHVALGDTGEWWPGGMAGVDGLRNLFQHEQFCSGKVEIPSWVVIASSWRWLVRGEAFTGACQLGS